MIVYDRFWETLKKKGITTYSLINHYGVYASLIGRLKHNQPISTNTLDYLCSTLDIGIEDIITYRRDGEEET